jgi:hypothetical protein
VFWLRYQARGGSLVFHVFLMRIEMSVVVCSITHTEGGGGDPRNVQAVMCRRERDQATKRDHTQIHYKAHTRKKLCSFDVSEGLERTRTNDVLYKKKGSGRAKRCYQKRENRATSTSYPTVMRCRYGRKSFP